MGNAEDRCICGHERDEHNDITNRCCFRVQTGWDVELDLQALRTCNLCPPSGFQLLDPHDSEANCWPKADRINVDELRMGTTSTTRNPWW